MHPMKPSLGMSKPSPSMPKASPVTGSEERFIKVKSIIGNVLN